MSMRPLRTTLGLAIALAATVASAAAPGQVGVRYAHPENFTEAREVRAFAPARNDTDYLRVLERYIERRATRVLQPDQTLELVITDIDRAGSYFPALGSRYPVRIVESGYPPRIDLSFRLLDSHGQVIRAGTRKLTDLSFLYDGTPGISNTDPLRYEKRLIDRWLAKGSGAL
jgi:hypothetical protein